MIANDGQAFERKNYVKLNSNKMGKYKPALRGAAFTNKMMAKKSNYNRFKSRAQAKILAEKAAHSVSAFGGLGGKGLDFGDDLGPGSVTGDKARKENEASFSGSAMHCAPKIKEFSDEESAEEEDGEVEEFNAGEEA